MAGLDLIIQKSPLSPPDLQIPSHDGSMQTKLSPLVKSNESTPFSASPDQDVEMVK